MLKLNRPLVFFDIESTGIDVVNDRIIDLGIIVLCPNEQEENYSFRFNPGKLIPEEATKIHGITNDDVKDCPSFDSRASEIFELFYGRDIAGYSSSTFDVPMLVEHFLRSPLRRIPFEDDTKFIDVMTIFKKKEERTLSAAVKFFLNEELAEAHSALADTEATVKVLFSQVKKYPDIGNDVESLSKFSQYSDKKFADYAGKLIYNEKGEVCFNIGRNTKGVRVIDDIGFAQWMLERDFPLQTKMVLENVLDEEIGEDPFAEDEDSF